MAVARLVQQPDVRIGSMEIIYKVLKDMDELRKELADIRQLRSDEGLQDAKLKTWTKRAYEHLKGWGFTSEAEEGFGRNSITHMYEGVDRRAKMRDDRLSALRDEIASHADEYESKLGSLSENNAGKKVETRPLPSTASKIFLGHGRSLLWHKVERYLEKDKHLSVEAWESESHAGEHVVEVLSRMLGLCAFGVVVVTGEDSTTHGALRARQNVVHEIGLFQGKLGFKKVALLEQEGTESFSNVHGLQTIRFPNHRIEAAFPELERTLRREGLIK